VQNDFERYASSMDAKAQRRTNPLPRLKWRWISVLQLHLIESNEGTK
jgi:hypothetical protein